MGEIKQATINDALWEAIRWNQWIDANENAEHPTSTAPPIKLTAAELDWIKNTDINQLTARYKETTEYSDGHINLCKETDIKPTPNPETALSAWRTSLNPKNLMPEQPQQLKRLEELTPIRTGEKSIQFGHLFVDYILSRAKTTEGIDHEHETVDPQRLLLDLPSSPLLKTILGLEAFTPGKPADNLRNLRKAKEKAYSTIFTEKESPYYFRKIWADGNSINLRDAMQRLDLQHLPAEINSRIFGNLKQYGYLTSPTENLQTAMADLKVDKIEFIRNSTYAKNTEDLRNLTQQKAEQEISDQYGLTLEEAQKLLTLP
ncbi:Uncharacterised protein [uncultured archaeon]|nr:Uncharacterised protein [uncultured archaeon]